MQKLMRRHDVRADKAIRFGEWTEECGTEPKKRYLISEACSCYLQSKIPPIAKMLRNENDSHKYVCSRLRFLICVCECM